MKIFTGATVACLALAFPWAARAQTLMPAVDQYGGLATSQCTNTTGHFILTKVNNRWWFCSANGHVLFALTAGNVTANGNPTYDCEGHNSYDVYLNKYGDAAYRWAWQTEKRLKRWGFNAVGQDAASYVRYYETCKGCVWPGGVQPIKLPLIIVDWPISYASVNKNNFAAGPIKDIMNGVNTSSYSSYRAMAPDVFDNNLNVWWQQELAHDWAPGLAAIRSNSPWVLGVLVDDSDYFWGSGAGPDYATGHTNANLGWITLVSSPVQTYEQSTQYGNKKILYRDTRVYSKAKATNPSSTCSISNPCSLRDYLWQKYQTISALNTAWGSKYTTFDSTGTRVSGEQVGIGNGSATVFTHTIAHHSLSPHSVLVSVGGTARAGDCPWFVGACRAGGSILSVDTGTIGSPASNYLKQVDSKINYSTGTVTITFVKPPASGTVITVNYIYHGWMSGGTGLMDESGENTAWVGTNPFCLEHADPNYPTYFSCVGGGGLNKPVPNANAHLGADLDAWVSQVAAQYFKTIHDDLRAVSQIPYLGLDTMGSWYAPSFSRFLKGAAPYIDAAEVQLRSDLPSSAGFQSAYQYTTHYLGDVPLINFLTPDAESDSAESCHRNTSYGVSPEQSGRGQTWYDTMKYLLNNRGYNGTYPFVSFDWWSWQDFQNRNEGLVSIHDNAYDGKEAIIAVGTDQWGYPTGGESANYGDALTWVEEANALWYGLLP